MNLFELFVKVGVDDQASGKLSNLSSKLGNGLKTAAKIGTAAVGAAAAGITALTKAAVDNYAEYEQLVGGVETLFKSSSDTVVQYAQNAYKTAGLSANDYMNTVTSFSASLLQSLGGDTDAAAKKADVAITDMADNANKMGTSIEMLQTTYAGFAKQNFTMLDNLKLGYGGTKEEMQRLLDDASKISGIKYDISSFADITDAIHVMQEEMGIAGATALEAGTTIQGSIGAMKGAWTNLVTGFADGNADIGGLINNLVTTIVGDGTESNLGVIGNVLPAIETALGGIVKLIEGAAPKIIEILPGLIDRIVPTLISAATSLVDSVLDVLPGLLETVVKALNDNLPILAEAAISIIQSLVDGISENQEMLMETAFETITYLANSLITMLPQIVQLGLDLIVSLANGIAESLPELIPTIVDVVLQIVNTLTNPETLASLVDASTAIIMGLADGLITALPILIEQLPIIIDNIIVAITENLPKIVEMGIELVIKLAAGLIQAIPQLVSKIPEIIASFVNGFASEYSKIFQIGKDLVSKVGEGFNNMLSGAKTWGKDMIGNFIGGIKEKWNKLKDTVKNVAQSVKDFLGFSEPKKGPLSNFHTYAPDMMDLFAKGIRDNEDVITDQIEKSFDFGERTMKFGAEYGGGYGVASAGGAFGGTSIGNINITIEGANYKDEQALAEAVSLEIKNMIDTRGMSLYA